MLRLSNINRSEMRWGEVNLSEIAGASLGGC